MKAYIYTLYDARDQAIDETSIDEDSPELAMCLFREFDVHEGYGITDDSGHYVLKDREEEEAA